MTGGLTRRQQASVTRAWGKKRALLPCNLHRLSVRIGIKGRVLASSSQTRQELSDPPCEIPRPHVCSRYHGHGHGKRSGQLDAEARSSCRCSMPGVVSGPCGQGSLVPALQCFPTVCLSNIQPPFEWHKLVSRSSRDQGQDWRLELSIGGTSVPPTSRPGTRQILL
ncbi:hypothetical protein BDP55DRAFT_710392 [Colletotrichum godetiae]|uniref:Uncharacterized protein n=1 Tax=Colletotrichum godetiae TaxID=1209918 RepID=A0AAJ0F1I2_9PEZI|nr:uncharacterized protein BDP55DRAFT_710392 [Colletotrichum godetiae]KAK1699659.1 hypothetical protein BDP55DRAFT_710392 [Colletotrichum godetiae]